MRAGGILYPRIYKWGWFQLFPATRTKSYKSPRKRGLLVDFRPFNKPNFHPASKCRRTLKKKLPIIAILAIYCFDAIFDTESALPDRSQLFETFVLQNCQEYSS